MQAAVAGCLAFLTCFAPKALAKEVGLDLTIFLEQPDKGPIPAAAQGLWLSGCDQLRELLENRTYSLGHGPFASVKCMQTIQKGSGALQGVGTSWALRINNQPEAATFEIYFMRGQSPRLEAKVEMGATDKLLSLLNDKSAVIPIELSLADQLPMLSIVKIPAGASEITTENAVLPKSLPERFVLYTLEYDAKEQLFRARPVGYAQTPQKEGKRITWRLSMHKGATKPGQILFVQNTAGRGENSKTMQDLLGDILSRYGSALTGLVGGLMSSLDANFSGARFGVPMLRSQDLVAQSAMFSLFTEVRGGPLTGLRVYYDTAPTVTGTSSTGDPTYFDWSRIDLSWAFKLPLPTFVAPLFEELDIDPKLGVYNLDALFEVTGPDGNPQMANFKIKRAVDMGFEAGLEHAFEDFLLRLWGGYNYSAAIVLQTKTSLSAIKGGIDIYWPLGHVGKSISIKLLTFASGEILNLGQQSTAGNVTKATTVINALSYQLLFLGIGGTVTW